MKLEILLMRFRSTTDDNFKLTALRLRDIIPRMFALVHIHYSRWKRVHIGQLLSLEVENREVFESFALGSFK